MSEEEKKAIEMLKLTIKNNRKLFQENGIYKHFNEDRMEATEIILNLIDKQQKEIEELKEKNASLQKEIKLMKSININDNYISKDKIRKLLNRYNKESFIAKVDLEELLEE